MESGFSMGLSVRKIHGKTNIKDCYRSLFQLLMTRNLGVFCSLCQISRVNGPTYCKESKFSDFENV